MPPDLNVSLLPLPSSSPTDVSSSLPDPFFDTLGHPIPANDFHLGRGSTWCGIHEGSNQWVQYLSRKQVRIEVKEDTGKVYITQVASNPSSVNSQRLQPNETRELHDGDIIHLLKPESGQGHFGFKILISKNEQDRKSESDREGTPVLPSPPTPKIEPVAAKDEPPQSNAIQQEQEPSVSRQPGRAIHTTAPSILFRPPTPTPQRNADQELPSSPALTRTSTSPSPPPPPVDDNLASESEYISECESLVTSDDEKLQQKLYPKKESEENGGKGEKRKATEEPNVNGKGRGRGRGRARGRVKTTTTRGRGRGRGRGKKPVSDSASD